MSAFKTSSRKKLKFSEKKTPGEVFTDLVRSSGARTNDLIDLCMQLSQVEGISMSEHSQQFLRSIMTPAVQGDIYISTDLGTQVKTILSFQSYVKKIIEDFGEMTNDEKNEFFSEDDENFMDNVNNFVQKISETMVLPEEILRLEGQRRTYKFNGSTHALNFYDTLTNGRIQLPQSANLFIFQLMRMAQLAGTVLTLSQILRFIDEAFAATNLVTENIYGRPFLDIDDLADSTGTSSSFLKSLNRDSGVQVSEKLKKLYFKMDIKIARIVMSQFPDNFKKNVNTAMALRSKQEDLTLVNLWKGLVSQSPQFRFMHTAKQTKNLLKLFAKLNNRGHLKSRCKDDFENWIELNGNLSIRELFYNSLAMSLISNENYPYAKNELGKMTDATFAEDEEIEKLMHFIKIAEQSSEKNGDYFKTRSSKDDAYGRKIPRAQERRPPMIPPMIPAPPSIYQPNFNQVNDQRFIGYTQNEVKLDDLKLYPVQLELHHRVQDPNALRTAKSVISYVIRYQKDRAEKMNADQVYDQILTPIISRDRRQRWPNKTRELLAFIDTVKSNIGNPKVKKRKHSARRGVYLCSIDKSRTVLNQVVSAEDGIGLNGRNLEELNLALSNLKLREDIMPIFDTGATITVLQSTQPILDALSMKASDLLFDQSQEEVRIDGFGGTKSYQGKIVNLNGHEIYILPDIPTSVFAPAAWLKKNLGYQIIQEFDQTEKCYMIYCANILAGDEKVLVAKTEKPNELLPRLTEQGLRFFYGPEKEKETGEVYSLNIEIDEPNQFRIDASFRTKGLSMINSLLQLTGGSLTSVERIIQSLPDQDRKAYIISKQMLAYHRRQGYFDALSRVKFTYLPLKEKEIGAKYIKPTRPSQIFAMDQFQFESQKKKMTGVFSGRGDIKYGIILLDLFTNKPYFRFVGTMKESTGAISAFIKTQNRRLELMNDPGSRNEVEVILLDSHKTQTSKNFKTKMNYLGVKPIYQPTQSHYLLQKVDSMQRRYVEGARFMLENARLPYKLWPHAIQQLSKTTRYFPLGNQTQSSFEIETGLKPQISDFPYAFGSLALKRDASKNQSSYYQYLGETDDGIVLWNPRSGLISHTRTCIIYDTILDEHVIQSLATNALYNRHASTANHRHDTRSQTFAARGVKTYTDSMSNRTVKLILDHEGDLMQYQCAGYKKDGKRCAYNSSKISSWRQHVATNLCTVAKQRPVTSARAINFAAHIPQNFGIDEIMQYFVFQDFVQRREIDLGKILSRKPWIPKYGNGRLKAIAKVLSKIFYYQLSRGAKDTTIHIYLDASNSIESWGKYIFYTLRNNDRSRTRGLDLMSKLLYHKIHVRTGKAWTQQSFDNFRSGAETIMYRSPRIERIFMMSENANNGRIANPAQWVPRHMPKHSRARSRNSDYRNTSNNTIEVPEPFIGYMLEAKDQGESNYEKGYSILPGDFNDMQEVDLIKELEKMKEEVDYQNRKYFIPKSINHAISERNPYRHLFIEAISNELTALKQIGKFKLVKREQGQKGLRCQIIFDLKFRESKLARVKSRLVARGDLQKIFKEFNPYETNSEVINNADLRLILGLTLRSKKRLMISTFDVKNAFLLGNLEKEVYLELPRGLAGFKMEGEQAVKEISEEDLRANHLWKINTSLYGLRQSAKCFSRELVNRLESIGFMPIFSTNTILFRKMEGEYQIITSFVDDLLCITTPEHQGELNTQLAKLFDSSPNSENILKIGKPLEFLGMKLELIDNDDGTQNIGLSSKEKVLLVVNEIEEKLVMKECLQIQRTPLPPGLKPKKYRTKEGEDIQRVQRLLEKYDFRSEKEAIKYSRKTVGMLMYITGTTRPDISYVTNFLSRRLEKPSVEVFELYKYLAGYLKGTASLTLWLNSPGAWGRNWRLTGLSDSSWADGERNLSTGSYMIFSFGIPLVNKSFRIRNVCLSSAQAEIMAMSTLAVSLKQIDRILHDLIDLRRAWDISHIEESPYLGNSTLTEELFGDQFRDRPYFIGADAKGALLLALKDNQSTGMRHCAIHRSFLVYETKVEKTLGLYHVGSEDNPSDNGTKALSYGPFIKHRDVQMGNDQNG